MGDTARNPCRSFWAIVRGFLEHGMISRVSFMGISAGVDAVMSMIAEKSTQSSWSLPRIQHAVLVAGVCQPKVFRCAAEVLKNDKACVLVHHHCKDHLCPWPPAKSFWNVARSGMYFYAKVLDFPRCPMIGRNFHDVAQFLLAQREFWEEFRIDDPAQFAERCVRADMGNFQGDAGEIAEPGYDVFTEQNAHFLAFALCACTAVDVATVGSTTTRTWLACAAASALAWRCEQHRAEVEELIARTGEHTMVKDTSLRLIPFVFLESMLQATHVRGRSEHTNVFRCDGMQGRTLAYEGRWAHGPLRLLQLTFPWDDAHARYADIAYTHVLQVPRECESFKDSHKWPLAEDYVQATHIGPRGLVSRQPDKDAEAACWLEYQQDDTAEHNSGPRMQAGDIVSLLLETNTGAQVGELIGVVHDATPKAKTRSAPAQHDRPCEVWLWARKVAVDSLSNAFQARVGQAGNGIRIRRCLLVKLHGGSRCLLGWGASVLRRPDLFNVALGLKPVTHAPQSTSLDDWLESARDDVTTLPLTLCNHTATREVLAGLQKPLSILYGPPGTGTTLLACCYC